MENDVLVHRVRILSLVQLWRPARSLTIIDDVAFLADDGPAVNALPCLFLAKTFAQFGFLFVG